MHPRMNEEKRFRHNVLAAIILYILNAICHCVFACQFSVPYAQPHISVHLNQIWHVVSLHPRDEYEGSGEGENAPHLGRTGSRRRGVSGGPH